MIDNRTVFMKPMEFTYKYKPGVKKVAGKSMYIFRK